jgi:beta-glucanase (GH16 family)
VPTRTALRAAPVALLLAAPLAHPHPAAAAPAPSTLSAAAARSAPALSAPALSAPAAVGPLTWADDFTGPAGAAPDPGRWTREIGGSGNGNHELQYYTGSASNAALDGSGNLVITARRENPAGYTCWYGTCQYTSARMNTASHFTQAYGRFEARLRVPRGQGMWPAFWMLGNNIGTVGWPNSGEIDVMENIGREPSTVHGTLHGPGYSGANGLGAAYTIGGAFADAFHTFAIDWAPGSVTFSVDGVVYERRTPTDTGGNPWVFDHPFFIILNLAVGGDWPGSPDGSTAFPQQLAVDYVHVFAQGSTARVGQITGLAGKCLDVAGANPANGTPVQLWTCNGTNAQSWTIPGDGTIRALGKCLDVPGGSTANGAKLQIWDCNGTGAQAWRIEAAGDIVNVPADKCMDVTDANTADGTRTQIWTCTGAANQKWTTP